MVSERGLCGFESHRELSRGLGDRRGGEYEGEQVKSNVKYDAEMRSRAVAEGVHLVTLDIYGKYAKKGGATLQGYLRTPEEIEKAWELFMWLAKNRNKKKPARKKSVTA